MDFRRLDRASQATLPIHRFAFGYYIYTPLIPPYATDLCVRPSVSVAFSSTPYTCTAPILIRLFFFRCVLRLIVGEEYEGIKDAVSGYLKATEKTANVPIQCQPHGLQFTVRASCRPSLILVYGAWKAARTLSPLAKRLTDIGYDVKVPAVPSPGTVPAVPDLWTTMSAVPTVTTAEIVNGKDVVMIMHSHGAVVGGEALKGITTKKRARYNNYFGISAGGVVRLIFTAGMVLPVGVSG